MKRGFGLFEQEHVSLIYLLAPTDEGSLGRNQKKIPVSVCSDFDPVCWKHKNPYSRLQFLENTGNWVYYGVIF